MSEKPTSGASLTAQDIADYAADLNSRGFSAELGWHWTVTSRETPDGSQRCLDRRDIRGGDNRPKPKQTSLDIDNSDRRTGW